MPDLFSNKGCRAGLRVVLCCLLPALSLAGGTCHAADRSGTATPERPLYRSSYRIINIHGHAASPDEESLRAELGALNRVGIDAYNVLLFDASGWQYPGAWSPKNLTAWLEIGRRFPGQVLVFGSVDFNRAAKEPDFLANIVTELEQQARQGMHGVKMWKNLGMYHRDVDGKLLRIDDPRLDPYWEKCGELGLPVLIHTADPREYWYPNCYNAIQYKSGAGANVNNPKLVSDLPKWEDLIEQHDNVIARHPKTQFIGAHFGNRTDDFDSLAKIFDKYPNFSVDTAARFRFLYRYSPLAVRDFFVKYQDRILFGTDRFMTNSRSTLYNPDELRAYQDERATLYSRYLEYLETDHDGIPEPGGFAPDWMRLKGIKLPPSVLEKIYHGNAERLVPSLVKATPARKAADTFKACPDRRVGLRW